jgi:hypothetical protein
MNNKQNQLNNFFLNLSSKRKALAESYAYYAPKLAPRFNCFDFISPDELKLSKILKELLDPKGNHAQGDVFLKLFFTEINIPYPSFTNHIKVDLEVRTDQIDKKERQIDIVVNFDDHFGLAIENKPWAEDQIRQLGDYAKYMEARFQSWCLVYLPGTDRNPSESSATPEEIEDWKSKNQYQNINYSHNILAWLKACEAQCQADHVRHFLRDFIAYCESKFLGVRDMSETNLVKSVVLESSENVDMAFSVSQQIPAIREKLLDKFINDVETQFKEAFPGWNFKKDTGFSYDSSQYKKLIFSKPEWKNYSLAVGFEKNQCSDFAWGIYDSNKSSKLPEDKLNELNTSLKGFIDRTGSWPWYNKFPKDYSNWSINIEPWVAIQSGDMVKMVINNIKELAEKSEAIIDNAEGIVPQPVSGATVNQTAGSA